MDSPADQPPTSPPAQRALSLLERALDGARLPALVLHEPDLAHDLVSAARPVGGPEEARDAGVLLVPWGGPMPAVELRTVLLVARDPVALRRSASLVGRVPTTREFGCVALEAGRIVPVRLDPRWPPVTEADARLVDGGAVTRVELAGRVPGHEALAVLAAGALPGPTGPAGLRVVVADPALAPPADPTAVDLWDPDAERPADVVLRVGATDAEALGAVSSVTGRAAVAIDPGLGPVEPAPSSGPADGPVRIDWEAAEREGLRRVVALAMAGVPLEAGVAPEPARALLGPDLADALADPAADRGVVRRLATAAHGGPAWRARIGGLAGVRVAAEPTVGTDPDGDTDLVVLPDPVTRGAGLDLHPDLVADLVLARHVTGAEAVVGHGSVLVDRVRLREADGLDVLLAAGTVSYLG